MASEKEDPSIDFLRKKYQMTPTRQDARRLQRRLRRFGAVFAVIAICGVVFSHHLAKQYDDSGAQYEPISLFSSLRTLVTSDDKALEGENSDRINILLMGIGGAGHDGPELTDTIIFASYQPSTNDIGMISIPRDLAVPIPGYGYRKINHINAYGEIEEPGSGPAFASQLIGELLGQEIHYYVKIDFNGFEDLIDAIGGVDVYVENAFTDNSYPTDDYLVQTISFEQGWQHMDGETALQFSRSRHAAGSEGSDFARAARQQKIILAVKDEVLSASTFLNPTKLTGILQTFQNNVKTDLTFWEMTKLSRYAPDIDIDNIHLTVLDSSAQSPLYSTVINGAYVLLPKRDDWTSLQTIAQNIFTYSSDSTVVTEADTQELAGVKLEIQNGTNVTGLAFQTSQLLNGSSFDVVQISNADSRDYETTLIYDLTEGSKDTELAVLQEFLEADVAMSPAGWVYSNDVVPRTLTVDTLGEDSLTADEDIDFLIILGQNAEQLVFY